VVIRDDGPEFVPESDEYLNRRSPVDIEGLVQCTLGGPMTLYNGGHLQGPGPPLGLGPVHAGWAHDAVQRRPPPGAGSATSTPTATAPASRTAMELETRRYVNDPDYVFP